MFLDELLWDPDPVLYLQRWSEAHDCFHSSRNMNDGPVEQNEDEEQDSWKKPVS